MSPAPEVSAPRDLQHSILRHSKVVVLLVLHMQGNGELDLAT